MWWNGSGRKFRAVFDCFYDIILTVDEKIGER